MTYYVFSNNSNWNDNVYLIEKFNNENAFIEFYLQKRLQCENDYINKNIKYDIMQLPLKISFFKKKMLTVYIDNDTILTYYVMKLPSFCNKFFEFVFTKFINL
jgi:hypothetical protein